MPKVSILRGSVASGKHLEAGQVYDISENDAKTLIRIGKAVPFSDPAPVVEDREKDLDVTTRTTTKKKAPAKKKTTAKKTTKKTVKAEEPEKAE